MRLAAGMKTNSYLTNLTDAEWARLEPPFPAARTGHPRHHSLRTFVNALLYVLWTGLCLAFAASGLDSLADRLLLPEKMAPRWHPGTHSYHVAGRVVDRSRSGSASECWKCR